MLLLATVPMLVECVSFSKMRFFSKPSSPMLLVHTSQEDLILRTAQRPTKRRRTVTSYLAYSVASNLDAMFHILTILDEIASPNARYKEKFHYSSIEESRKRINNGIRECRARRLSWQERIMDRLSRRNLECRFYGSN
jgi:hypothetical protein